MDTPTKSTTEPEADAEMPASTAAALAALEDIQLRNRHLELERVELELRRDTATVADDLQRAKFRRKHPYQAFIADILRPKSWAQAATLLAALSPVAIGAVGFVNDQLNQQMAKREAQEARVDKLLVLAIDSTLTPQRRILVLNYIKAIGNDPALQDWANGEVNAIQALLDRESNTAQQVAEASKVAKDEVAEAVRIDPDAESADEVEPEQYAQTVKVYERRRQQEASATATAIVKQAEAEKAKIGLETEAADVLTPRLETVTDPNRCEVVLLSPAEATRTTTASISDRVRACKHAMKFEHWAPETLPGNTVAWKAYINGQRVDCRCNLKDSSNG